MLFFVCKNKYERGVQMDNKENKLHPDVGEDTTKYGEFVSSYFAWIPLPEQKQKAEEMNNMTKKEGEK